MQGKGIIEAISVLPYNMVKNIIVLIDSFEYDEEADNVSYNYITTPNQINELFIALAELPAKYVVDFLIYLRAIYASKTAQSEE